MVILSGLLLVLVFYLLSLMSGNTEISYLYIQDSCDGDDDYRDLVESIIDKWSKEGYELINYTSQKSSWNNRHLLHLIFKKVS